MPIFQLPAVFGNIVQHLTQPPKTGSIETRNAQAVVANPIVKFYDPSSLNFPDAQGPVVKGDGGYITQGLGCVVYDHQPTWSRDDMAAAGPVREFFAGVMFDNRVKRAG